MSARGCFDLVWLGKSTDKGIRSGKMKLGLQGSMGKGSYNTNHLKEMVVAWF